MDGIFCKICQKHQKDEKVGGKFISKPETDVFLLSAHIKSNKHRRSLAKEKELIMQQQSKSNKTEFIVTIDD